MTAPIPTLLYIDDDAGLARLVDRGSTFTITLPAKWTGTNRDQQA